MDGLCVRACVVLLLASLIFHVVLSYDCDPPNFQCFDGKGCIASTSLCNGIPDCKDGSDEDHNCSTICDRRRCDYCRPHSRKNATCECYQGHEHSTESSIFACQDIDECAQQPPPCSQECHNIDLSYSCICKSGYTLAADGHSCRLNGDAKLVYGTRDDIHTLELHRKNSGSKILEVHSLQDIAFQDEHTMFFADFDSTSKTSKLYKVVLPDIAKSRIHQDFDFQKIISLQYDVLRSNLYILDTTRQAVVVCSLSACATIYTQEQLGKQASNMVLHEARGVMFWAAKTGSRFSVMSGGMDGKDVKTLVNTTSEVTAIAVDVTTDQLYYCHRRTMVKRVAIAGPSVEHIVRSTKTTINSLAVFENELIWAENQGIKAANKFNGTDQRSLTDFEPGIVSMHVAYANTWEPDTECVAKFCRHICLVGRTGGATCACPSGYRVSGPRQNECEIILEGNPVLLASSGNQIQVVRPASDRSVTTLGLVGVNVRNLGCVVWLAGRRWILFSQNLNGQTEISRLQDVNLDRGTASGYHRVLENLESVGSLVVDEGCSVMFFLNKDEDEDGFFVEMASLDGKWRTPVATDYEKHYLSLALNENLVYISTLNPPRILRCKLRHAELRCDALVSVDLARPVGLAVTAGMLYWADVERREIASLQVNARAGRRTTLVDTTKGPLSLVVSNSTIFWTEESSRSVKFHMFGSVKSEVSVPTSVLKLALVAKAKPAVGHDDECSEDNGGCDQLCWGGQCLCDENFHLADDDRSCVETIPALPECDGLLCDDGQCEKVGRKCDDFVDCADGSDESNCKGECETGELQCHDQRGCYHSGYKCDGEFDCDDQSDELGCSCDKDEFDCGEKPIKCILNMFICDEDKDCEDGRDEKDCGSIYSSYCTAGQFACQDNHTCIPLDFKCDGQRHCPGGEDEDGCDPDKQAASCEDFSCYDGTCLAKQQVCDGRRDCPLGEEEDWIHCPKDVCDRHQFQCSNEQCIHKYRKCDGNVDCEDGSDESLYTCPSREQPSDCAGFQCSNGKCIDKARVCDKYFNCDDGSDEINCNETCETMTCPHDCQMTATGPRCICPPGQEMRPGKVCLDINECKSRNGNCSHTCVNHFGSYRCACPPGYTSIDHYCKATGPRHTIYVSTPKGVAHISHSGYSQSLVIRLPYLPLNLDVDIHANTVYWTALMSNRNTAMAVYRNKIGQDVEKVAELNTGVSGLAIDWLTGNIVFSKSISNYKGCINVMDPVSGHQKTIVNSIRPITKIALHPQRGLMYWLSANGLDGFSIVRGSILGSHQTDVVALHEHPGSLVVDTSEGGRMYWHSGHTVETAKLDGSDRFAIATNLPRILAMDVFGGLVHISTGEGVQMLTAAKPSPRAVFTGQAVAGVKVSQDMKQPGGGPDGRSRECANKCVFLCVLAPHVFGTGSVSAVCLCPDGFITDDSGKCRDPNATTVATTTTTTLDTSSVTSRDEKTTKMNCPLNCKNGGKCTDLLHIWVCICPGGFKGSLCQLPKVTKVTGSSSLWWVAVLLAVLAAVAVGAFCCFKKKSFLLDRFNKFYPEVVKYQASGKDDTATLVDNSFDNPNYQDEIHKDLDYGLKNGKWQGLYDIPPLKPNGRKRMKVPTDDEISTDLPGQ